MPTTVTVRYFASIEDQTGVESEEFEIDGQQPLSELLERVTNRHPGVEDHLESAAVAVNMETVDPDEGHVQPGDEVGLLPPFGGGDVRGGRVR